MPRIPAGPPWETLPLTSWGLAVEVLCPGTTDQGFSHPQTGGVGSFDIAGLLNNPSFMSMVTASPAPAAPAYGQNSHRHPRVGVPAAPPVRLLSVKHRGQTEPTSSSPAPPAEPFLGVDMVTAEWLHLLPEVPMRLGRAWRPQRKATFCAEVHVPHRASPRSRHLACPHACAVPGGLAGPQGSLLAPGAPGSQAIRKRSSSCQRNVSGPVRSVWPPML